MSYELNHATTECPNEDCWYIGNLEEFTDEALEDEDFGFEENSIELECPKCGHKWTATVEPVVEYRVD